MELARSIAAEPDHPTSKAWAAYVDAIAAKRAEHTINAIAVVAEAEMFLEDQ